MSATQRVSGWAKSNAFWAKVKLVCSVRKRAPLFTHKRTHLKQHIRRARDEKMELPSIPKKMSEVLGIISIKIHRIQNTFETITYT